MPENLVPQIPYIKKIVELLNIPLLEMAGFEADDVLGTVSLKAVNTGFRVTIVTGDKDLMQLVEDNLELFDSMTGKKTGIKEVEEKFGVIPEKVTDVLGLMGDSSDNIPGVPGIGPKTGIKLIQEFSKLETYKEQALLSKRLATIKKDVPVEADIESFKIKEPNRDELVKLFAELE